MTLWRSLRKVSAEGESRPEIRDGESLRQKDRDTGTGAEARFFVLYSGIAADRSFASVSFLCAFSPYRGIIRRILTENTGKDRRKRKCLWTIWNRLWMW